MAEKKSNPGHQLLVLAFFLFWAALGVVFSGSACASVPLMEEIEVSYL